VTPGFESAPPRCPSNGDPSPEEVTVAYHERTKHHYHRYAASAGHLDWATQPNPFRRYAEADLVRLPMPARGRPLPYWQVYARGEVPSEPLSAQSLSLFFRYALSLTAWKRFGETTWSLRANPSSGNLHPTEGYAVLPAVEQVGDAPAVYHYAPKEHALERRAILDAKAWGELSAPLPDGTFLVGLSSVHWREAWKYGERAFRYCQHDAGHALATLRIAAAALGWGLVLVNGNGDSRAGYLFDPRVIRAKCATRALAGGCVKARHRPRHGGRPSRRTLGRAHAT
jgi:SagB-type dehydrogenase family enzyme